MDVARLIDVEQLGKVLVLNLRRGVEEAEFNGPPPGVGELMKLLRDEQIAYMIVDCHEIDFLRSTALGFFVTLWQRVKGRGGYMAFCNTSEKAREVLAVTKLDRIWRICDSRDDALADIK